MRYPIATSLLFIALAHSGITRANENDNGMNRAAIDGAQTLPVQAHKAQGVVNKVDFQNGKINLTHGPIKSLGWSGMTMDFAVKDATILKHVQAGEKVNFEVVNEGPGKYFVTKITPEK
jgi:Cu/Ag efflux protein CusF